MEWIWQKEDEEKKREHKLVLPVKIPKNVWLPIARGEPYILILLRELEDVAAAPSFKRDTKPRSGAGLTLS